jgi:C-terminal processing protease CtpA/Prc/WD40 repeat protein
VSDADGLNHVYLYDFRTNAETRISDGGRPDAYPVFSPDGKKIAYNRDGHELHVRDLDTKTDTIVARGYLPALPPLADTGTIAWSPAGDAIAYIAIDPRGFSTVHVARLDGRTDQHVSYIANGNADDLAWSPDATRIYYVTSQRTEPAQVVQIDLVPRKPIFREDRFRDLFNEEPTRRTQQTPRPVATGSPAASPLAFASPSASPSPSASASPAAAKRTTIVLDEIRERATFLPVGVDVDDIALTTDGKTLVLTATAANQHNVYAFSLDELSREEPVAKQLTSTSGTKASLQVARDGKEAYILDQGRVSAVNVESGRSRAIAVTAELDTDIANDKTEMFQEAWNDTNETFFSPTFNGVDWKAIRAEYEPYFRGARTYDEVRRLLNMMDGELDASHMGAGAPRSGRPREGNLAIGFDPAEYERTGRLKLNEIVHRGPVALAGDVHLGDMLVSVDGVAIDAHRNVDELLQNTIGKRTMLGFETEHGKREVAVQPISDPDAAELRYRDWVESRRAIVARISGGRVGYVHMKDMSQEALTQLYTDLDTENEGREGVVIDIRNNNGGFVDPYVADVFQRRDYLRFTPRNGPGTSGTRAELGQRALNRKTVLVTNAYSLSDAENFTEGYRALKLGRVVGEPTAGWIIFTSGTTLVDGTSYRLPYTAVTTIEGQPLERHPRPVDMRVARPLGESGTDDAQLRAATESLLRR